METSRWLREEYTSLRGASLGKIISTGLLLGVVHVLTGPDHLSALAAMTTGSSWRAFTLGIRWGCGHSVGLIIMALIFFGAGQTVNLDAVGGYINYVVGFFMIALGLWTAWQARKKYKFQLKEGTSSLVRVPGESNGVSEIDCVSESDANTTPSTLKPLYQPKVSCVAPPIVVQPSLQLSMSPPSALNETLVAPTSSSFQLLIKDPSDSGTTTEAETTRCFRLRPSTWTCCQSATFENPTTQKIMALFAGIVHGIAGPGGILGVLPAVVLNDWTKSVAYLSSFCVASIFIMGVFAALYGDVTGRLGGNSLAMEFRIGIFSASFSIIVGLAWISLQATGQMSAVFGE